MPTVSIQNLRRWLIMCRLAITVINLLTKTAILAAIVTFTVLAATVGHAASDRDEAIRLLAKRMDVYQEGQSQIRAYLADLTALVRSKE